jgi:hypothetical protein
LKQIETMEALNGKIGQYGTIPKPRLSLGESSHSSGLSKHQQAMFGDKSVVFGLETKQDIRCPGVLKD